MNPEIHKIARRRTDASLAKCTGAAQPHARPRKADDAPRNFGETRPARRILREFANPDVTRADEFDSLAAAFLERRRRGTVLVFDEGATHVGDGLQRFSCEFLDSFADGRCGDAAERVEVGSVEVALCSPHAEQAREERGQA